LASIAKFNHYVFQLNSGITDEMKMSEGKRRTDGEFIDRLDGPFASPTLRQCIAAETFISSLIDVNR
jgi:hypothetical protein